MNDVNKGDGHENAKCTPPIPGHSGCIDHLDGIFTDRVRSTNDLPIPSHHDHEDGLVERPGGVPAAGLSYDNTTYLPIYYVMHALDSIHITSSWDGTKKEWKLTFPSSTTVDYSNLNVGTGDISIYINNQLVKKINGIAYTDPASGIPTMYLPVWYAMGVFERMGITPSWDGTHWGMTQNSTDTPQSPPASQGPQDTNPQASSIPGAVSKETLVKDLTTLLNVSKSAPTQSAYDDVPLSNPDAAAITTAVNQHWISAFSSTHFGAGDVPLPLPGRDRVE
ncbi:hypothetical protein [Alicyclobacillus pomorum]|uniref:hypothetical protein n=1 Tax=Alicyclobacillus pomorum TaxID=204470 RepID=UPI0004206E6A